MVFPYPMDPMMVFPYPMDLMMVFPYPMDLMMVFPYPMDLMMISLWIPMLVFPYPLPVACSPVLSSYTLLSYSFGLCFLLFLFGRLDELVSDKTVYAAIITFTQ